MTDATTSASSSHRSPAIVALLACLVTGGYVLFNLGVGFTATAVVAAASTPYAVVPIVMNVSLLGESSVAFVRTAGGAVSVPLCRFG